MKTLVLSVDRDNDLGEKTGLPGPVIGRDECLKAATELGIKDPEETDTNAIFKSVQLFDTLKKEGKDVEIAIVTGNKYLGEKADRTIADQLDMVLDKVKPQKAILVSDGVSDEAMMPILQSRVKIDHVHRFEFTKFKILKWEEKIYAILRYINHDSIRIGIGVPVTLFMIFYGAFAVTGYLNTPKNIIGGSILVVIGVFFLTRALLLQERVRDYFKMVRRDIKTASLSPIMALVAMILLVIGSFFSYDEVVKETGWVATWQAFLLFALSITWWVSAAILLRLGGAFIDNYIRFHKVKPAFLHDTMQVVAFSFIIYGMLIGLYFFLVQYPTGGGFPLLEVSLYIIVGVITAALSATIYRVAKSVKKKEMRVQTKAP
jgi:putative membrane protein